MFPSTAEQNKKKIIKRYSHSILSLHCPRNIHKVMRREKVEVLPMEATETGRQFHRLLAEILNKPIEARNFKRLNEISKVYGDCTKQFNTLIGKVETEKKIRIKIGKYIFTVVIDVLVKRRKEVDIIDHKSTFNKNISPIYIAQLEEYALPFLRKGFKVRLGIHLIRWGRIEWVAILEGFDDYTQIADRVIKRIQEIEEISKGEPIPIPNTFECTYCSWPLSCPEAPKMFIGNNEQASALAGEYIRLKSKLKAAETLLKIYCNRVGHIYMGDTVLGYNPQDKKIIDQLGLLEFFKKNKINITEVFTAQASKLTKLTRRYDDIANFVEIIQEPKWSFRKLSGSEQAWQEQISRLVIIDEPAVKKAMEQVKTDIDKSIKKFPEIKRFVDIPDDDNNKK